MPSVEKFARLNLEGLTILRIENSEMQLWSLLTMWHNLDQCHKVQHILLTCHCNYPTPGFLVSSSHPLIRKIF